VCYIITKTFHCYEIEFVFIIYFQHIQVRQAIIWGASAVIMLAMNAETLKTVNIMFTLEMNVFFV
jgi:hypothetical protein